MLTFCDGLGNIAQQVTSESSARLGSTSQWRHNHSLTKYTPHGNSCTGRTTLANVFIESVGLEL
eukprot:3832369-Amphidinium_carterae.1